MIFFISIIYSLHLILFFNYFKNNENIFLSVSKIILSYLIFTSIILYLILINIKHVYIQYFTYLIFLISFLIIIKKIKIEKKFFKKTFSFNSNNLIIFIYLLIAFLYSNLPPIDIDSLRYHLLIGKKISQNNFFNNITLDYIYLSYSEIISYIGQILKFNNLISIFNFFGLILVYIFNKDLKNNYNFGYGNFSTLIVFSIIYLLSNIYSQKLYFLLCVLSVYSLIYLLHENKKINLKQGLLYLSVNYFCFLSKNSFLLLLLINYIFIFLHIKKGRKIYFVLVSIFLFCFFYFPIFLIKIKLFGEPFIPFLVLKDENFYLTNFIQYFINYGPNLKDIFKNDFYHNILNAKSLITPSNLIGVSFVTLFFSFKKSKFLLPLILYLFSILIIGNLQSRWFIPIIILSSLIFSIRNNFLLKLFRFTICFQIYFQIFTMSYFNYNFLINNKKFFPKYYHAYNIQKYLDKNYKDFIVISDLEADYYFKKHISLYQYNIIRSANKKKSFISLEKDKYYIIATRNKKILNKFTEDHLDQIKILSNDKKEFVFTERNIFRKNNFTYFFVTFLAL